MEIIVLVDNNTLIDNYMQGEPALSFFIKDNEHNILFDTGYSDLFSKNAKLLDINIHNIDYIVLSHGHDDHTGGLKYFQQENFSKKPKLITHPDTFYKKIDTNNQNIGIEYSSKELSNIFDIMPSAKPLQLTKNLFFLGEIPRKTDFEAKKSIGYKIVDNQKQADFLLDDSALVYKKNNEIVIITGCAHSGIINIIQYAKEITKCNNIKAIIGGFHLANNEIELINKTIDNLKTENIKNIYPCHCTELMAKCALLKYFNIQEIGTGSKLKF